ncbi:6-phosphogluconolactonase [Kaistia sp. 32K]|uniref:lactonase family protein n=1 Tax=Kaistia sp. 32K TaxID=2795690 RepID=UPI0019154A40|nr:lactonase family protein [Kaistia sp. 32K]BCP51542.1 6-phosphogluconolactonase [Kaistia sp. 32K]
MAQEQSFIYVGGCNRPTPYFASANARGISVFGFDPDTAVATLVTTQAGIENPTFLAASADGGTLYATSEVMEWNEGLISAYRIDPATGKLAYINRQSTLGGITAHASLDRSGRNLLLANYIMQAESEAPNQSVAVFPRRPDGGLKPPVASAAHTGHGPDASRQDRSHAHCVLATPDNRYIVVSDLGTDRLVTYRFDAETGAIETSSELVLPPGSGPRHFVFHPTKPFAYAVHELGSAIASLAFDAETGSFTLLDVTGTVAEAARPSNHCSEIRLGPDGRFLYVANRGHDSLSIFTIGDDGIARLRTTVASGGRTPRHFAFAPDGRTLAVANQDSDCISLFAVDPDDGGLTHLGQDIAVGTPTSICFVTTPG